MSYLVIKCGGSVMDHVEPSFFENIITLMNDYHVQPVIVHGGGPAISNTLKQLNIETQFVNGLRVTDNQVLDVAEMVLSGFVNKSIVRNIIASGGDAIGLSGVDDKLLQAIPFDTKKELGYVGKVDHVNTGLLHSLFDQNLIPVISPIGIDKMGQRWNINADLAAAAVAKELQATLCLITDVKGVMKNGEVLPLLTPEDINELIKEETITGGMIPKVKAAVECLQEGIEEVVILDGMEKDAMTRFVGGEKVGTSIIAKKETTKL